MFVSHRDIEIAVRNNLVFICFLPFLYYFSVCSTNESGVQSLGSSEKCAVQYRIGDKCEEVSM